MNTYSNKIIRSLLAFIVAIGGLALAGSRASAAPVPIELCALPGTATLTGAVSVPIWGFGIPSTPGDCGTATASLPGPGLEVNEGDVVTITLDNALPAGHTASFELPGLPVSNLGGGQYQFTASRAGTFTYQSSGDDGRQMAMGLYGALIVRPTSAPNIPIPGQAYSSLISAYDIETTLVLSQVDPNFNAAPDGFNMLDYHATYWLINGKAYPDTAPISAPVGSNVLIRYVNAGYDSTTMALLGMHENVIARDAYLLNNPFFADAETIPAGATEDVIATIPSYAPPGTNGFALYNRQLHLTNGLPGASPGGMMTFITPGPAVDQPPLVNAGVDQNITLPASANLDGTVTDDGLSPLTTQWTMTSGPGTVTFGNDSLVDTTASFSVDGVYILRLTATDGTGSVFDEVTITVFPVGSDQPPTVNAGVDQTITLPASASLDGTVTDDGLSPLTTQWSQTSGPGTVTFGNDSLVDTTASFSVDGVYVLRLTATDGTGSVFDEVSITVNPAPPVDQPPTVNAGVDQTITLPASASLDGTVTDDGLSPLTTQWSQTSGPGTTTFGDASLVDTTASFSAAGSYILRLTATDGTGSVFDEVAITVNPAPVTTMHIGALSGLVSATSPGGPGGGTYTVDVTITVHDAGHSPLNGVTVSGTWTSGAGGLTPVTSSCVTNASGVCTVQATHNLNPNNAGNNATFTANNLTLASYTYVSGDNDVPNSVTVSRP